MGISIRDIDDTTFEVEIAGTATTTHLVTVTHEYIRKLTGGQASAEELVRASFEFLLEHEPNTSILRRFDLRRIQDYFADYETVMKRKWRGN
jgi:hypothetical protein